MSWVAVGVAAVGVVSSLYSSNQANKAAGKEAELQRQAGGVRKRAADLEADTLETQASNTIGAAQRDMIDLQRSARLAESRAIALAAASGGGASTAPTIVKLVGNIAKEGSYNSARAMYAGEEKARLMRLQAKELRDMGEFAVVGGNLLGSVAEDKAKANELATYGTIASNSAGLYAKYGGKGPDSSNKATPTSQFYYTGGTPADPSYG